MTAFKSNSVTLINKVLCYKIPIKIDKFVKPTFDEALNVNLNLIRYVCSYKERNHKIVIFNNLT